ncbi:hypothetical protein [Mesoplasma lactucae]|uniref:Uncharacterized protein n=1 Tax=Mesoplasma lactucae ATCC 49193 TaxID=81460 RepID=A0A291IS41_9MOLU|nr:hypothetical protein [Mesoplasma lactucae]ATG97580.1 hypothetical protein CP520_02335 [Mesoplasma lactucae ATCC 49193]ATZ19961.1 hypothetical protein MLACT_v1c01390 [Mesoplasma lactucae ATCC 49193]MCL8217088.1 hypothetical protein [Mesoplasma lactucae ATCC 49193]
MHKILINGEGVIVPSDKLTAPVPNILVDNNQVNLENKKGNETRIKILSDFPSNREVVLSSAPNFIVDSNCYDAKYDKNDGDIIITPKHQGNGDLYIKIGSQLGKVNINITQ